MSTDTTFPASHPELWGGLECTINRVGNKYRDQLAMCNHYNRPDDLDKVASLGIKKMRYPILWEKHQPVEGKPIDWNFTAVQLNTLRNHQIVPIAGLLHHGSGPAFTSLLHPDFPEKFATYAHLVAQQFPWLTYFTPVNEPLTTARFSGLYGLWYPHANTDASFLSMLLNQLKATVLAMQEIRKIIPDAKLVQTEDLGNTLSTKPLAYQAQFENDRRWLTLDILCGNVNEKHPLWDYLLTNGTAIEDLEFFINNPCPPDIAGFNYYVTSERYLDHAWENYSEAQIGTNGFDRYADTEAVRQTRPAGLKKLLQKAWKRYHLPMALTEIHLQCTREEQLRWFQEAWDICKKLRDEGIDIRAVTAWSMMGAFDWCSLLVKNDLSYESGVFEMTKDTLRPTALARLIQTLGAGQPFQHPVMKSPGWWHRSYPQAKNTFSNRGARPLLILGSGGTLGTMLTQKCIQRAIVYKALNSRQGNILIPAQIEKLIQTYNPWAIINAAGYVRVDEAEQEMDRCFALNTTAPCDLAFLCQKYSIPFVTFSSDLVFDGAKNNPYEESDVMMPLNTYGKSKADAELQILQKYPQTLIIRTSSFFGPADQANFACHVQNTLRQGNDFIAVTDVIVSPTYVPHLAEACLDLLIDKEAGVWHITNEGSLSWYDFAMAVADGFHLPKKRIIPRKQSDMQWAARRPSFSSLKSTKGLILPSFSQALSQYMQDLKAYM